MNNHWLIILVTTTIFVWTMMMIVTFTPLLCRTSFGGVWSSIVIDDCRGSYWTPTNSGKPVLKRGFGTSSTQQVTAGTSEDHD